MNKILIHFVGYPRYYNKCYKINILYVFIVKWLKKIILMPKQKKIKQQKFLKLFLIQLMILFNL